MIEEWKEDRERGETRRAGGAGGGEEEVWDGKIEGGSNHGDTTKSCQESTVNCFTNTNFPACSCFGMEYIRVIRCIYGTIIMPLRIAIKTQA